MRDKNLYAQIPGIKHPWQVTSVELTLSKEKSQYSVSKKNVHVSVARPAEKFHLVMIYVVVVGDTLMPVSTRLFW